MEENEFYHAFVQRSIFRERKENYAYEINLTKDQVLNDVVIPFKTNKKIICNGEVFESQEIIAMKFYFTAQKLIFDKSTGRTGLDSLVYNNSEDVTRQILEASKKIPIPIDSAISLDSNQVFIVHGHDSESKLELARLIEKEFKLNTIILHEQPNAGSTIIEKLERVSLYPGYVFVILTPDDIGAENNLQIKLNELGEDITIKELDIKLRNRARQNVILELGYFMAKVGRSRVCCLFKGDLEIPSDIFGVLYLEFIKSVGERYNEIRRELINAGFSIKLN